MTAPMQPDPVVRLVEDLDRSRKWLVYKSIIILFSIIANFILTWAMWDVRSFLQESREQRSDFQCTVERALDMEESSCG